MFELYLGLQQKPTAPNTSTPNTDPYFANVVLLMHCNGANNGTTFVDSSGYHHALTTHGAAKTLTAAAKFGSAGMYTDNPLPGYNTDFVSTISEPEFQLTADFTFECWVQVTDSAAGNYFFCVNGATTYSLAVGYGVSVAGKFNAIFRDSTGASTVVSSDSVGMGSWYYIAVTLQGTTLRLFRDGVLKDTQTISTSRRTDNAYCYVGYPNFSSGWHGYIDELRLTTGVARYTANFTPTTQEFPDGGETTVSTTACLPRGTLTTPFSVVALPCLFINAYSAPINVVLAVVTSTDTGITPVILDENGNVVTISDLTFTYASGVLTLSGICYEHTKVYSIAVCYQSSDGSGRAVGSSTHDIVISNHLDVLTIGSMVNPSLHSGDLTSRVILSPSANYAVGLKAVPRITIPGLNVVLSWTVGASSASGTVSLVGTPTTADTFDLVIDYYNPDGSALLGTSTHVVLVGDPFGPTPDPTADTAGPTPIAAVQINTCTDTPQGGLGSDALWSKVRALYHFDRTDDGTGYDLTKVIYNGGGKNAAAHGDLTSAYYARPSIGGGAFGSGLVPGATISYFAAVKFVASENGWARGPLSGAEGLDGKLTVECMVNMDQDLYSALSAGNPSSSTDVRFAPVISLFAASGGLIWTLGFASFVVQQSGTYRRLIQACFYDSSVTDPSQRVIFCNGNPILAAPTGKVSNRFVHMCANRAPWVGSQSIAGCWYDGVGGSTPGALAPKPGYRETDTSYVQIGGTIPGTILAGAGVATGIVFSGMIDEGRITAENRYGSYIDTGTYVTLPIPAGVRTIPFPSS